MKRKSEKDRIVGFRVLENECIWMKAGVINFRLCDNDFDCATCAFDRGMRRAMDLTVRGDSRSDAPHWIFAHLKRRYDGAERPVPPCAHRPHRGTQDLPPRLRVLPLRLRPDARRSRPGLRDGRAAPAAGGRGPDGRRVLLSPGPQLGAFRTFRPGARRLRRFRWPRFWATCGRAELPPLGEHIAQGQVGWILARQEHHAALSSHR